jgi:hypothetical protein
MSPGSTGQASALRAQSGLASSCSTARMSGKVSTQTRASTWAIDEPVRQYSMVSPLRTPDLRDVRVESSASSIALKWSTTAPSRSIPATSWRCGADMWSTRNTTPSRVAQKVPWLSSRTSRCPGGTSFIHCGGGDDGPWFAHMLDTVPLRGPLTLGRKPPSRSPARSAPAAHPRHWAHATAHGAPARGDVAAQSIRSRTGRTWSRKPLADACRANRTDAWPAYRCRAHGSVKTATHPNGPELQSLAALKLRCAHDSQDCGEQVEQVSRVCRGNDQTCTDRLVPVADSG